MSEPRDACQASGKVIEDRTGMSDRTAGLPGAGQETAERVASLSGTIIQDGREWSGVELHHVSLTLAGDVVGPLLHHRPPTLEQIGALIGPLHAFDDMGQTGFGHFS